MSKETEIEEILDTHYDAIFAFSVRALGCREEAQDLTQDVCLSLAEKLPDFKGESKVTTWLFRIVSNAAMDRLRTRKRRERLDMEWRERACAEMAEAEEARDARAWMRDAMEILQPSERATLALVVTGGFSQAEAAEILEISPGTVAWRMSEIRRRLAAQVENDGGAR